MCMQGHMANKWSVHGSVHLLPDTVSSILECIRGIFDPGVISTLLQFNTLHYPCKWDFTFWFQQSNLVISLLVSSFGQIWTVELLTVEMKWLNRYVSTWRHLAASLVIFHSTFGIFSCSCSYCLMSVSSVAPVTIMSVYMCGVFVIPVMEAVEMNTGATVGTLQLTQC